MNCASTSAATSVSPINSAAAPSPTLRSSAERGAAMRQSLATTSTFFAVPAFTASSAGAQRSGTGAQRAAEVGGDDVAAEIERLGDDAGALLLLVWIRRRGEQHAADAGAVDAAQAVGGRRHRHGHAVLVEIGDRALAAAAALALRPPPAIAANGSRHIGMYAP